MENKTIIGLTGNIGTGKTAVMNAAAERGVLTIDADRVVHQLMQSDNALQKQVVAAFGQEVVTSDGKIDRPALGRIVFADQAKMEQLEALVHPSVRQKIREVVEAASEKVIMIEAIKLLEGELAELCDQIWVANCGKFLQMQRLIIGRGMSDEDAFQRIASQSAQGDKLAKADVVIQTTGTLEETRKQVFMALRFLGEPDDSPAKAAPAKAVKPAEDGVKESEVEVVVRRARPQDIPAILLLIHKATDGRVKPKRAEILMSLSERGYLIGQVGNEISTVVGWYADKGFGAIDQMYVHPAAATVTTGKAVLEEIKRTANELMCEAVFAFLNDETQPEVRLLMANSGYAIEEPEGWPRVWQQTFSELKPDSASHIMITKLWNARVA